MVNGEFSASERAYLLSLDAVDDVKQNKIFYSDTFKVQALVRYESGERPKAIFESVGLFCSLIGYKRIERAFARWKENKIIDILSQNLNGVEVSLDEANKHKRGKRQKAFMDKNDKIKKQLKDKDAKIAYQAREIERLTLEVEALKELRRQEMKLAAEEKTLSKSDKFALIQSLHQNMPKANIKDLCTTFELSRSGFYKWCKSKDVRIAKDRHDAKLKDLIMEAFKARGFLKGSRQIRKWLKQNKGIVINRKCIQRIMRKFNIVCPVKPKKPYAGLHSDGEPKVAPNLLNRNFFPGIARKVFITDITYVPTTDTKWLYLSVIKDSQTGEILAWQTSSSLKIDFVLDCLEQLKQYKFAEGALIHSDQGVHYTSHIYHDTVKEMGLLQSMSRKANCHDNACIESFFGRMKYEMQLNEKLTYKQTKQAIDEYVGYYNEERSQSRLGYKTPKAYALEIEKLAA